MEPHDATRLDVLAFGAHPDDVELFMGGTVALLTAKGYRVGIADLTRGELGTRGTPQTRAAEAALAARILGLSVRVQADLGDGHLHDDDRSRRIVVDLIRTHRPRMIFGPLDEDVHPDHENAGRLLRAAVFLAGLRNYAPALPPHRADKLLLYPSHTQAQPHLVIDISAHFEVKRQAADAYGTQFHDPKSAAPGTYLSRPEFKLWWEARSRHYGQMIAAAYGEPFFAGGPIPVEDPMQQFLGKNLYPPIEKLP